MKTVKLFGGLLIISMFCAVSAQAAMVCIEHEGEARAFLQELQERMHTFDLALHPDKTRLIRFGRHAVKQRENLGEGKPETFDFLGFTHFCRQIGRAHV